MSHGAADDKRRKAGVMATLKSLLAFSRSQSEAGRFDKCEP